jgi:hypothetical protein
MKKTLFTILIFIASLVMTDGILRAQQASAQPSSGTDQDIQLMRKDVRSQKKQIVAANMSLTDAEAEKFWPIYDQYTAETTKIYDTRFALIQEYAQNYSTMTDAQAVSLAQRWGELDVSAMQLRLKYIPILAKALSGKKAALFFQIDRRLALMIDLQLASAIPLVQP